MAAKLETTSTPGIYRRHRRDCERSGRCECSYVTTYRAHGRQHTETHRTLAEAREAKRRREAEIASGEFVAPARLTLREYALEWVERYQGTGKRGFREETRDEYRRLLNRYALRHFPPGLKSDGTEPAAGGRLHRVADEAARRRAGRCPTRRRGMPSARCRRVWLPPAARD